MKVIELQEKYAEELEAELIAGQSGLKRTIQVPEVDRPGLGLTGYEKGIPSKRVLLFGRAEMGYLKELTALERVAKLRPLFKAKVPAVFVARHLPVPRDMRQLCDEMGISLFRSRLSTMVLLGKLLALLLNQFAPVLCCHGSFVEVFGMGVLIQGESSVGKSEAALGLIERGHRLISDDLVKVRKLDDQSLEGHGSELTRHHLEVRGVGIINISTLYGAACVTEKKSLDIVVKLEVWDDSHFYDRAGLEEKTVTILGTEVPYHILPVKPGRDVVLLLETIALNHRLQTAGFHAARELDHQLLAAIEHKHRQAWVTKV